MHISISGSYECYMDFLHRTDVSFCLTHGESVWVKFSRLLIQKALDTSWHRLDIVLPEEKTIDQQGIRLFSLNLPVLFYSSESETPSIYGAIAWHNNNVILPSPCCNRALVAPLVCSIHT